ncbi:MAG: UPF0164 family protein [Fidelibacterota bacterium]
MNKNILILFLISGLLMAATNIAGYSGSFLRMGTTARSMAMGSAFTAVIDDGFASYHNPAAPALFSRPQVSVIHHALPLDRQLTAVGFGTKLPPAGGVSLALLRTATTGIDGRTSSGEKTGVLTTSEMALFIGFAQQIKPWLAVGANLKIMYHYLPLNADNLKGNGSGFDIGILVRLPKDRQIGLVVQDLNSGYHWNSGNVFAEGGPYKDVFPASYRLGISTPIKMFRVTADAGVYMDGGTYLAPLVRAGVEYTYRDQYYMRAGFGNGRVAFGTGLKYRFRHPDDSTIDYAIAIDATSGINHILTFGFSF